MAYLRRKLVIAWRALREQAPEFLANFTVTLLIVTLWLHGTLSIWQAIGGLLLVEFAEYLRKTFVLYRKWIAEERPTWPPELANERVPKTSRSAGEEHPHIFEPKAPAREVGKRRRFQVFRAIVFAVGVVAAAYLLLSLFSWLTDR